MPNWAEGNIRFRGKRENLIRFFTHELVSIYPRGDGSYGERPVKLEQTCDGWRMRVIRDRDTDGSLYFRGSNRQFVDSEDFESEFEFSEGTNINKDQIIILSGYRAAWNVDKNYWKVKAEEYKIDIRTFVWEQGLEWSSVNTWYRTGKTEEEVRSYSEWLWDASMPYYGG